MRNNFSDIPPLDKTVPGVQAIEQLLQPRLHVLYRRRAERLRVLDSADGGSDEVSSSYLGFAARLVEEQARFVEETPLSAEQAMPISALLGDGLSAAEKPSVSLLESSVYWQDAFKAFVRILSPQMPQQVAASLHDLAQSDKATLAAKASALLNGTYEDVEAGASVFLWAGLSVFWSQAVALAQPHGAGEEAPVSHGASCPCCGAPASGGLVLTGDREGLRYLQCSLCETRWHKVRAACTMCGGTEHVDYWSFDTTDAPIQVETCGDCHGYIKLFRQDRDPDLEVVADDLSSLGLDAALEEQGFIRAALNPFSFPSR